MMSPKHSLNKTTSTGAEHIPLDAQIALDHEQQTPPHRKKSPRQAIQDIYFEYCSNTSLHGVQYLGQRRPWKEIFFWLFVFVISLSYCSTTIEKIYDKWRETPVIVSFSEHSTPVSAIPFPAVTICSESRRRLNPEGPTYAELLEHVTSGPGLPPNLTTSEREQFLTLLHSCNYDNIQGNISRLSNESIDYFRVLNEMSVSFGQQLPQCKWFGITSTCEDLFTTTYTEDGLCYTFNGFNGTDLYRENTVQYQKMGLASFVNVSSANRINRTLNWSLDQGYPKNTPLKMYPARLLSASSRAALEVVPMAFLPFLDYGCSGATQGVKVVLHTPDDVPLLSKRFVRVSIGKEVLIAVKPVMVTTSDGIAGYPVEKRKCYMKGDRELTFFKVYSEKNCEMECLTNYTLKDCGCVKYAMPRTPDMPVCAEDKIQCYIHAEDKMLLENFHDGEGDSDGCNCMPSCTSLEFDTEISQADFDSKKNFEALGFDLSDDVVFSRLLIYFKDNEFVTSKRSELYGFTDFLANCGGILGLFMGFSILSIVEVLYHFTLRLWSNMTRKKGIK